MNKYRHFSDLHGFNPDFKRSTDKDEICIIAGDSMEFGEKGNALCNMMKEMAYRFKEVIFVPGNHEYYGTTIDSLVSRVRKLMDHIPNFTLLQDGEYIERDGVRIIGATLWSDASSITHEDQTLIMDYQVIRYNPTSEPWAVKLTPIHSTQLHYEHVFRINEALTEWEGDSIVITHHAPSMRSIDPLYEGSRLNPAFATDIKLDKWPNYWIHGHIHLTQSYMLNGCNIRCNPGGYRNEHTGFEPLTNYFYL